MIAAKSSCLGALAFFCVLLFGCRSASAQVRGAVDADLRGTLLFVDAYGPPGFGEDPKHDQKISYLAIQTDTPVDLPCPGVAPQDRKEDCRKTRRLKLQFFNDPEQKLENYAVSLHGHRVLIHGRLYRRLIANDETPIVCEVVSIRRQPQ